MNKKETIRNDNYFQPFASIWLREQHHQTYPQKSVFQTWYSIDEICSLLHLKPEYVWWAQVTRNSETSEYKEVEHALKWTTRCDKRLGGINSKLYTSMWICMSIISLYSTSLDKAMIIEFNLWNMNPVDKI